VRIGTGVDHNVFEPINKEEAREALGIPRDSKLFCLGLIMHLRSTTKEEFFSGK
jgi:hypothetical protein